jgi:hypothetical protein
VQILIDIHPTIRCPIVHSCTLGQLRRGSLVSCSTFALHLPLEAEKARPSTATMQEL